MDAGRIRGGSIVGSAAEILWSARARFVDVTDAAWPFGWKALDRLKGRVTDVFQEAALGQISYAPEIQKGVTEVS